MSAEWIIGTREIVRRANGAVESLGAPVGGWGDSKAILEDLVGQPVTDELVQGFYRDVMTPKRTVAAAGGSSRAIEITEDEIDRWAAGHGLTLGKHGIRGL